MYAQLSCAFSVVNWRLTTVILQNWLAVREIGGDRRITLGDRSHLDLKEYLAAVVETPGVI